MRHVIQLNFIDDPLQTYLGGRYRVYLSNLESFFSKLSASADLVFCFAGRGFHEEIEWFIDSAEFTYDRSRRRYNNYDAWDMKKAKKDGAFQKPSGDATNTILHDLQEICKLYGQIRINYHRHYPEMAKYIKEHEPDILSVITYMEYFLAIDGRFEYWLLTSLEWHRMTVTRFNRDKLYQVLDVNAKHLILLSAITESDFLPKRRRSQFQSRICNHRKPGEKRMQYMIEYVKDHPIREGDFADATAYFDLDKVCADLFRPRFSEFEMNGVVNCIKQFNIHFEIEDEANESLTQVKSEFPFLYKLMVDEVFLLKENSCLDLRKCKSKTYAELMLPVIRKLLGIIFANDPERPSHRLMCAKHVDDEPARVTLEEIIYPEGISRISRA